MDRLWKDIGLVYENFNFRKKNVGELSITSKDNYYEINYHHQREDKLPNINIKIEIKKEYNLWSDVNYPVTYLIGALIHEFPNTMVISDEKLCIEKAYELLRPYLREIKLEKVGI